jgi:hypothetical protein
LDLLGYCRNIFASIALSSNDHLLLVVFRVHSKELSKKLLDFNSRIFKSIDWGHIIP